jgi:hypothetical protein
MKLRSAPPVLVVVALSVCAGAGVAHAAGSTAVRAWKERVAAPAQFDLGLAEIRFGAPARLASSRVRRSRAASSIRIALRGPTGLDYVAAAVTRFSVFGHPGALVLVVNKRPRGSLAPDLVQIALTVTAPRRFGAPVVSQVSDPFTRPAIGLAPALCDLPILGASLRGSDLRAVLSRGLVLAGYGAEAAIAQAYDAVCGRPYDEAFRQAVTQRSGPVCATGQVRAPCCPPNAICAPPPCEPCPCGVASCPCVQAPCPCAPVPCVAPPAQSRLAAIACPLQTPPIACPL